MREVKDFIKDKKIDLKRLEKFGFKLKENSYYYDIFLLNNQFKMTVKISLDNSIFTEIIDTETNETYVLHLLEMKRSGYSEKVYKAYNKVLEKIQKECFEDERFKTNYTKEVVDYNLHNSPEEIEKLIDNKRYFPAYHMNKKHWCTICLDGTVELKEIYELIDISYELAK